MKAQTTADVSRLAYVGAKVRKAGDAENDDWYTPTEWLEAARYILGGIGLDPFTSVYANQRVRAKEIFTLDRSAFDHPWNASTVWMNPPYSRGLVTRACNRFLEEYAEGHFKSGLVLVNNMTDTQWYRRLVEACRYEVLITGRISFENAAGQKISGNTRGQTLFLFTDDRRVMGRFKERMLRMGQIVRQTYGA